ncbi:MAG: TSUP family transporter [Clostridia bacterium]|nr:TSUP family transporter [Clostridia bacterium]
MGIELISFQSLLCCLAFFCAGVVDSITGGGGLITIPVMLAVGIPVHYITGTNQCSAWLGTGAAAYKYVKSGNIHLKSAVLTLPFAVLGSYIGARLNLMVPDRSLKIFMLAMVPVIAAFVLANRKLGEEDRADGKTMKSVVLCSAVIGLVLGGYQGFYGPGSGLFFMLAYAALLKLNLVRATGNTRFVIAIASITSVFTYAASGAVLWKLAIAATAFNVAGSCLGAALAIKNGAKIIRPIMLCVVALLIVKLIADVF